MSEPDNMSTLETKKDQDELQKQENNSKRKFEGHEQTPVHPR